MRLQALTRHAGASFHGGAGTVYLRALNARVSTLTAAWDSVVVQRGLGQPLVTREGAAAIEGWAPVYPFLPLTTLSSALRAAYAGRALSRALRDELALAGTDAWMYEASYGLHVRAATRRGWPAQALRIGFFPAVLVGAGKHARLLAMNLPASVSAILTLAGINKSAARDLLSAHGLPVAPGGVAGSPQAAVRIARRIGGPVVVKRLVGGSSDGVIVGLRDSRDIASAARLLLQGHHAVIVESAMPGTELRLHFLAGRLHRAFLAEPFSVAGDGQSTLTQLLDASYPQYLRVMCASSAHRRRLVMCLWGMGVRRVEDMDRIVPDAGLRIRVSAATGAGMKRVSPTTFLRRSDISRLETFLAQHGAPSCGIDLIVSAPRAPMDDSCCILEINVPCGFAYLDKPQQAVTADLNAAIAGDRTFRKDKGRVPLWLVMDASDARFIRRTESFLTRKHGRVSTGVLSPKDSNWISLANQPHADALLVITSEEAIAAHGIPLNLAARLMMDREVADFRRQFPLACATVTNAGGAYVPLPKLRGKATLIR